MNPGKVSEVTYKRAILKNLNSKNEGVKPGVNAANIQLEDITAVVSSNCILKTLTDVKSFMFSEVLTVFAKRVAFQKVYN